MNFNEAAWPDGVDDLEIVSPSMIREQPEIVIPGLSIGPAGAPVPSWPVVI